MPIVLSYLKPITSFHAPCHSVPSSGWGTASGSHPVQAFGYQVPYYSASTEFPLAWWGLISQTIPTNPNSQQLNLSPLSAFPKTSLGLQQSWPTLFTINSQAVPPILIIFSNYTGLCHAPGAHQVPL